MTIEERASAKIFRFPQRARSAGESGQAASATHERAACNVTTLRPAARQAFAKGPVVKTYYSGAWYHDEAIREADRARKS